MFITSVRIDPDMLVTDLVKQDYRTVAVFRKYGIEFCCTGRIPLSTVCESLGLELESVRKELEAATRPLNLLPSLPFREWSVDFLIDYILHVHHRYLRDRLPFITEETDRFVLQHRKKYPELAELQERLHTLANNIYPHLVQEEEVLFPYCRQIAHAFVDSEPYASLLVRTLRKPVEVMMNQEHDTVMKTLTKTRELTNNYTPPSSACVSHRVAFSLLAELDNDLLQHLYLENEILYPRAIEMEKELLER